MCIISTVFIKVNMTVFIVELTIYTSHILCNCIRLRIMLVYLPKTSFCARGQVKLAQACLPGKLLFRSMVLNALHLTSEISLQTSTVK